MSQQINVNIRMDSDVKEQADALFREFGLTMTAAINMFVRQTLRDRAIPFIIGMKSQNEVGDNYLASHKPENT